MLSASEQQKSQQLAQLTLEKAALEQQLQGTRADSSECRKLKEQLQELAAVREQLQGVKAEKIVLEEKVVKGAAELEKCRKELGTFICECLSNSLENCLKYRF